MTICIAALCEGGKSVVVAADREITIGFPLNIAFEHHERKIDDLIDRCVVLSSGNALVASDVIGRTRAAVSGSGGRDVRVAGEALRDAYMAVHLERAEQLILRPRGWDLEKYRTEGAQRIPQHLYTAIDQLFWNFMLNTDFMIAGVDEAGAHIGWVHYHGVQGAGWLEWFDKLGYQTIGSGSSHAAILLSLTGQNRDLSLGETVYNVYCAKVNAEVAPGVGDSTDLAIITEKGNRFFSADEIQTLEDTREAAEGKTPRPDFDKLIAKVRNEQK